MENSLNDPMLVMSDDKIMIRNDSNYLVESRESIFDQENEIEIGNLNDYLAVFSGMEDI